MSMKLDHYYVTKIASSFINNYNTHVPFLFFIFDHEAKAFFIIYAINATKKKINWKLNISLLKKLTFQKTTCKNHHYNFTCTQDA